MAPFIEEFPYTNGVFPVRSVSHNQRLDHKWWFSIVMSVYQRVYPINIPLNHYKITVNHYKIPIYHHKISIKPFNPITSI